MSHSALIDHYVWICGNPECGAKAGIRKYRCGAIVVEWINRGLENARECDKAPKPLKCSC